MHLKSILILKKKKKKRLGFETSPGHCGVFLDKTLYSPLFTQEYKWVPC